MNKQMRMENHRVKLTYPYRPRRFFFEAALIISFCHILKCDTFKHDQTSSFSDWTNKLFLSILKFFLLLLDVGEDYWPIILFVLVWGNWNLYNSLKILTFCISFFFTFGFWLRRLQHQLAPQQSYQRDKIENMNIICPFTILAFWWT